MAFRAFANTTRDSTYPTAATSYPSTMENAMQPAGASNSRKRQRTTNEVPQPVAADAFIQDQDAVDSGADDDDDDDKPKDKKAGRRKIKIEFIQDKSRRHITFSKRKAGIMKKAYELSTLTGTQVLLLVVSETGLVYTFTTAKLQPLVTQPEGKNLIQACLNAPHGQVPSSMPVGQPIGRSGAPMSMPNNVPGGLSIGDEGTDDKSDEADEGRGEKRRRRANSSQPPPPAPAGRASPSAPMPMPAPGNQLSSQPNATAQGMTHSPAAQHAQPPQQGYPGQPNSYPPHSQETPSPAMYGNGHVLPPAGAYYAGTAPQGSPTTPHMQQHGQPWGAPPGQAVQQGAQYARR